MTNEVTGFNVSNGRYCPCLDDCFQNLTLEVPIASKLPFAPIAVRMQTPKALSIMGDKVHFLLDKENNAIYIRGHIPGVDTQAPLWHAMYLDEHIHYVYGGHFDDENTKHVSQINWFISRIRPAGICAYNRYSMKGFYSYEDKALIFFVNEWDYEKAKKAFCGEDHD